MALFPEVQDDARSSLLKGLLYGGLGIAALRGLATLGKYVYDKAGLNPTVFDSGEVKYIPFAYPTKEAMLKKASVSDWLAYGIGIPTGAYATAKLLDFLYKQEKVYKTQNLIRAFDKKVREEVSEEIVDKGFYAEPKPLVYEKDEIEKEIKKMSADKDIDDFININVFMEKRAGGMDVVKFLTTDMITKWLPLVYGGLVPLGAISGYQIAKAMNKDNLKDVDILNTPELQYQYTTKEDAPVSFTTFDKKQAKKRSKGRVDIPDETSEY